MARTKVQRTPEERKARRLARKERKAAREAALAAGESPPDGTRRRPQPVSEPVPKGIEAAIEELCAVLQKDKTGITFCRVAWSRSGGQFTRVERNVPAGTYTGGEGNEHVKTRRKRDSDGAEEVA